MNKILPTILCAAALFGCRTHSVTPDESWADYNRYYNATGETAVAPTAAVDLRMVPSAQVQANIDNLKAQGFVVLGSFKIEDGTDISHAAVMALAQKLNAGAVVWCAMTTSARNTMLTNPDLGIPGVDYTQAANMMATRSDQSFAEQTMRKHEVWMLGKMAK